MCSMSEKRRSEERRAGVRHAETLPSARTVTPAESAIDSTPEEPLYEVFLTGYTRIGREPLAVAARLATLLHLPEAQAQGLLQGHSTCLKSGLDARLARQYRALLRDAGAEVRIEMVPIEDDEVTPAPPPERPRMIAVSSLTEPSPADASSNMTPPAEAAPIAPPTVTPPTVPPSTLKPPTLTATVDEPPPATGLPSEAALPIEAEVTEPAWALSDEEPATNPAPMVDQGQHKARGRRWLLALSALLLAGAAVLAGHQYLLPAYQDYRAESAVQQALQGTAPLQAAIGQYIRQHHRAPTSAVEIGKRDQGTLADTVDWQLMENGVIYLAFQPGLPGVGGETLTLTPFLERGQVIWDCTGGTLGRQYRPAPCQP